jgi:AhpD family alkylhydroperoxidase
VERETSPERYERLKGLMGELGSGIPATMSGFGSLHRGAISEGALNKRTKELIALGMAIALRCDGCIAFHVHDALQADASRQEILETIGVAILMGGGPALMYGCEAHEALDEFQAVEAR